MFNRPISDRFWSTGTVRPDAASRGLAAGRSPVLAVAVAALLFWCWAPPVARAAGADCELLETFIKLREARLSADPRYREAPDKVRWSRLCESVKAAGIPVTAKAKEGPHAPAALASRILSGLSPEKKKSLMSRVRQMALAEEPDKTGGEASSAESVDPSPGSGEPEPESQPPAEPPVRKKPSNSKPRDARAAPGSDDSPATAEPSPEAEEPPVPDVKVPDPVERPLSEQRLQGAQQLRPAGSNYTLGPRDAVDIVFLDKQISPSGKENEVYAATVNLEGKLLLPLLGIVDAQGLTVDQLRERLIQMYRKYIQNPRLTSFIKEFNSKKVYLIGDGKSGVLPLSGETMTLFDVIAAAGGLAPTSDKKHLIVIRGNKKFVVNYQEELLKPGGISDRFIVQPGDRIIVPRPLYKVTILGGVNKAGDLDWDESMTLLRAIAQAGSFNDNARKDRIKIIRKSVDTKSAAQGKREQTISVNVDKIFQGKVQDISLRPGDTIYVTEW